MSAPPAAISFVPKPSVASTYCTSLNPSARSSSSARYCGVTQIEGSWTNRIWVVSGGGSAMTSLGRRPRSPTVPASVSPPKKSRRLKGRIYWVRIGTSIPDAGQCATENTSQWTLLPLHKQAQHLTMVSLDLFLGAMHRESKGSASPLIRGFYRDLSWSKSYAKGYRLDTLRIIA